MCSIHNLGLVGHIEDIAVTKDQQGKKLGLRIIEALDFVAKKVGCYKVRSATFVSSSDLKYALGSIIPCHQTIPTVKIHVCPNRSMTG